MEDNIYKGFVSFIKQYFDLAVLQGLQNRSALIKNCIIITFLNKKVLGTPISRIEHEYDTEIVGSQVIARYQIDVFGDNAYNNISRLRTLLSHEKAIKHFKEYNFAPVVITDIKNLTASTIVNEEYFRRYSMDLNISYRDNTSIDIRFIDDININTLEVANGIINE